MKNINLAKVQFYKFVQTPIGRLQLVASDKGLMGVFYKEHYREMNDEMVESDSNQFLIKAEKQLAEYFAGKRKEFDVKLDMQGTVFQINAWRELQKIPYGETISYGEQAKRVGDAKKARAVGTANGRNPFLIIVPCHRVVGAGGALGGFSSGGIPTKKKLLELEKAA
jgi:methylated-DNA-[protein]-cysteine S-methyltransferase